LTFLDLEGNKIDSRGAEYIAKALENNKVNFTI